jgi:CubicO group peptidase (beta-lactamase class C family)
MSEELDQGTDAWRLARCGWLGASSLGEALARDKKGTGWGASRANLLARLVVERVTGKPMDTYINAAMQHGLDTEAEARAAYQFEEGVRVTKTGFHRHPSIFGTGASPDGLIGDDGAVEIKCPQPATHLNTILGGSISQAYKYQVQWQMVFAGRQWVDWCSYCPSFPDNMRLHIQRVQRDDRLIAELEAQVREFLLELDKKLAALVARFGAPVQEAA